jgi:hypothetical protein
MPYEPRYKPEDVLNVLDFVKPTNIPYIVEQVGCSRDIAKINLERLEAAGKVKKVETLGVKESLWVRCDNLKIYTSNMQGYIESSQARRPSYNPRTTSPAIV